MRVLKWIVERCAGEAPAADTMLGLVPEYGHLDWSGLDFAASRFSDAMGLDPAQWEREISSHDALFARLGDKRPERLMEERNRLAGRMAP
jgi:phosphoenolpyruvate carboxykinase (GTP)